MADSSEPGAKRRLAERILQRIRVANNGNRQMTVEIPNTAIRFELASIPAGKFWMGSQQSDPKAMPDEKPSREVELSSFSMQTHTVTWHAFWLFQFGLDAQQETDEFEADALARPTKPYLDLSRGMGTDQCPVISITQHAANQYAQWLSAKTGQFYRLPTEAEWEYACRAGSTTQYFYGDGPRHLAEYAWFDSNSEGRYHPAAQKWPNSWGLFDMLGNVFEWTLDQYQPYTEKAVRDPWAIPTAPYPMVVRGGSWADAPELLRCAARVQSTPVWKRQDPQLPKSIWYTTDAPSVGFRLVRPDFVPELDEAYHYWNNGVEYDDD